MRNINPNLKKEKDEMLLTYKRDIIRSYKDGDGLGRLCRKYRLDISTILYVLGKSKLKKKSLYRVYQNQNSKLETQRSEIILEKDKYYLDKFFPLSDSTNFSSSYRWFWKEELIKAQKKKEDCKHRIRHISCGSCNKILRDATHIPLDEITIYKDDQN